MAGASPGDVGLWNSHFRIGGAAGSKVKTVCSQSPTQCMAAWGMLHLTSTSSAYIENMWGWTADHDLDGGPDTVSGAPVIATGRGALVEATKGTWLVGTAMEHNTLYQYNFNLASNVASIFQQSETPYWQGPGRSDNLAPAPWTNHLQASDPKFNNCPASDALCRMAWFQVVSGANNIFMYGGCVWVFFNGGPQNVCNRNDCQTNAMEISHSTGMYVYGTNVKGITNMISSDGVNVGLEADNVGGWTGVIAAYLFNSGS
jgi:glucan 1,3-beta-glucosidase